MQAAISHRETGMRIALYSRFAAFLLVTLPASALSANTAAIVVEDLAFSAVSHDLIGGNFLEAALTLRANRPAAAKGGTPFVHRQVAVTLWLAFARHEAPGGMDFYRSEAHLAGLVERTARTLYFYLPPEIVESDRLREPVAWLVEISAEGVALPLSADRVSPNLGDPERVASFRRQAEPALQRTDGILLSFPQSPFYAAEYPAKLAASPSYAQPPRRP